MRSGRAMPSVRPRGVTLMELLVVVVVIGILASIAVPSYRNYMIRTHRTDATCMLLRIQSAQEKFYLQNNRYSGDLVAAPADGGLGIGAVSEAGKYDLSVAAGAGNQSYVATAAPRAGGGQNDDTKCRAFTIDERGTRRAVDSGGAERTAECWR
jgi:type IV pilus assembly protein PilE